MKGFINRVVDKHIRRKYEAIETQLQKHNANPSTDILVEVSDNETYSEFLKRPGVKQVGPDRLLIDANVLESVPWDGDAKVEVAKNDPRIRAGVFLWQGDSEDTYLVRKKDLQPRLIRQAAPDE